MGNVYNIQNEYKEVIEEIDEKLDKVSSVCQKLIISEILKKYNESFMKNNGLLKSDVNKYFVSSEISRIKTQIINEVINDERISMVVNEERNLLLEATIKILENLIYKFPYKESMVIPSEYIEQVQEEIFGHPKPTNASVNMLFIKELVENDQDYIYRFNITFNNNSAYGSGGIVVFTDSRGNVVFDPNDNKYRQVLGADGMYYSRIITDEEKYKQIASLLVSRGYITKLLVNSNVVKYIDDKYKIYFSKNDESKEIIRFLNQKLNNLSNNYENNELLKNFKEKYDTLSANKREFVALQLYNLYFDNNDNSKNIYVNSIKDAESKYKSINEFSMMNLYLNYKPIRGVDRDTYLSDDYLKVSEIARPIVDEMFKIVPNLYTLPLGKFVLRNENSEEIPLDIRVGIRPEPQTSLEALSYYLYYGDNMLAKINCDKNGQMYMSYSDPISNEVYRLFKQTIYDYNRQGYGYDYVVENLNDAQAGDEYIIKTNQEDKFKEFIDFLEQKVYEINPDKIKRK